MKKRSRINYLLIPLVFITIFGCTEDEEVTRSAANEILGFVFTTEDNSGFDEPVTATFPGGTEVLSLILPFQKWRQ
ncbi:MAG: hypothetical protein AAGA66_16705 [Bacteroidota bacterium]